MNQQSFQLIWRFESRSIQRCFDPYIQRLKGTIENNIWHMNDDVYEHTLAVFRELLKALDFSFVTDTSIKTLLEEYLGRNMLDGSVSFCTSLLVGTILHDIGKKETYIINNEGQTSRPGHEAKGEKIAREILREFDQFNNSLFLDKTAKIIAKHTAPHIVFTDEEALHEKFTKFISDYPDIAIELALLGYADTRGCQLEHLIPVDFNKRMNIYTAFFNSPVLYKSLTSLK